MSAASGPGGALAPGAALMFLFALLSAPLLGSGAVGTPGFARSQLPDLPSTFASTASRETVIHLLTLGLASLLAYQNEFLITLTNSV